MTSTQTIIARRGHFYGWQITAPNFTPLYSGPAVLEGPICTSGDDDDELSQTLTQTYTYGTEELHVEWITGQDPVRVTCGPTEYEYDFWPALDIYMILGVDLKPAQPLPPLGAWLPQDVTLGGRARKGDPRLYRRGSDVLVITETGPNRGVYLYRVPPLVALSLSPWESSVLNERTFVWGETSIDGYAIEGSGQCPWKSHRGGVGTQEDDDED
jgi:hypothetical protein